MKNPILKAALASLRAEYTAPLYGDDGHEQGQSVFAPWMLARSADCAAPERNEIEGGAFLCDLFDSFINALEFTAIDEIDAQADASDIRREIERLADNGHLHEIADSAVPVYTHRKWQTFVQLAAYEEDVSGLIDTRQEVTGDVVANAALYIVADRLLRALCEELADKCDEWETL